MSFEKKLKIQEEIPEAPELEKIAEEEAGVLRKLGSRAKGVARVLTLFTAVSMGCSLSKLNKDESGPQKPAYTDEETVMATEKPSSPFDRQIEAARENISPEEQKIMKLIEKTPWEFLGNTDEFAGTPNLARYVQKASFKAPESLFNNIPYLQNIPGLDLKALIIKLAQKDPGGFYINLSNLKDVLGPDLLETIKKAAAAGVNSPWVFLNTIQYIPKDIPGLDLTPEAIAVCNNIPHRFIGNADKLKNIMAPAEWQEQLEKSFTAEPEAVKGYGKILKNLKQPELESTRVLQTISDWSASLLLNDMVKHGLSEAEAVKIAKNENELFKALVKIKCEPEHLGRITVEKNLKTLSLKKVKQVNDLHEETNDAVRFKSVNDATPEELYSLSVYGEEEEIFTSTFNGFFNRMLAKMRTEKLSGEDLLQRVNKNRFRTFIKECAGYNRLNEFLKTMSQESAHALLVDVIANLDKTEDKLAQATTVADIFGVITDQGALTVLQEQIKLEYDRVSGGPQTGANNKILYGILAGMFGDRALVHKDWFDKMSSEFKLGNFTEVKSAELFNSGGVNVQEYLFYNDKDGLASFKHFMAEYQNDRKWQIEKRDHYAIIRSVGGGKKIEMYVSYPEFDLIAPDEIEKVLQEKNLHVHVIAHRGHSYHTPQTINGISPDTKIVSLGGCGGYNNLYNVLERSLNAHIISTKGTGTMYVNDPLFKMLNEAILSGKDVSWPEFWARVEKKLSHNKDLRNYVAPHKNLGAMFLKTYRQEMLRADSLLAAK